MWIEETDETWIVGVYCSFGQLSLPTNNILVKIWVSVGEFGEFVVVRVHTSSKISMGVNKIDV